jgi:transcription antitermination factor NusG
MSLQWYVACAHQGQERLAKQQLEAQQFEVYLPMCISARGLIRPFLAPYIFVKVDLDDRSVRWRALYSTRGVRKVLQSPSGDRPQVVPAWVVEEIMGREVGGLVKLPPQLYSRFGKGDRVRVVNGGHRLAVASALDAVFETMVDRTRAKVFVSLLGRQNGLVVPLSKLTAASAGAVAVRTG